MTPDAGPALVERYRAARRDAGLAVLEGLHALKHALRFGAELLDARSPDPVALQRLARALAPDVAPAIARATTGVPPDVFAALAPSPHTTGVIALARRPLLDAATALAGGGTAAAVLLERPTHHGNIGAVVRVAAAAGAAAVLTTGSNDPWHPGAIRGGAGLQFALPVLGVDAVPASDRPLVVVDPEGEPARPGAIPPRALLAFGSERSGVTAALRAGAAAAIAIPMRPGVSSLNLATAVAVVLYCCGATPHSLFPGSPDCPRAGENPTVGA
ncbi:MAG TPA: TrmH family RNA methyltransferase [Longimicrobiales bacterium]|nr:TrmH family RNA methyltransferase [Longimicrobiales bacterium]